MRPFFRFLILFLVLAIAALFAISVYPSKAIDITVDEIFAEEGIYTASLRNPSVGGSNIVFTYQSHAGNSYFVVLNKYENFVVIDVAEQSHAWAEMSPDGKYVSYNEGDTVCVIGSNGRGKRCADDTETYFYNGEWSIYNQLVMVGIDREDEQSIPHIYTWYPKVNGSTPVLFMDGTSSCDPQWSKDGQMLVYRIPCEDEEDGTIAFFSTNTKDILGGRMADFATWSPDSKSVAYVSYEGENGLYIEYLETGEVVQISEGYIYPWSVDWTDDGIIWTTQDASYDATYMVYNPASDDAYSVEMQDDCEYISNISWGRIKDGSRTNLVSCFTMNENNTGQEEIYELPAPIK